jgi:hypothetical protein
MPLIQDSINFSKYERAFYFGCSFTDYYWPTWADIVSQEIPKNYKYAKCGAGNFYIYQAVVEAIITHKITENDLVMVMFSNVTREDRYTKSDGWITPGNLFHQNFYDEKFMKRFFCEKGYLMRDLTLVEGVDRILSTTGADYSLMSMIHLDSYSSDHTKMENVNDVLQIYQSTLNKIKPSVFEIIFNNNWNNRPLRPKYTCHWADGLYTDNHPIPTEHLEYLQKMFPKTEFSDNTINQTKIWTDMVLNSNTLDELKSTFIGVIKEKEQRL